MADILPPGAKAPDFTLNVPPDQKLSLHELRGRRVMSAPRSCSTRTGW